VDLAWISYLDPFVFSGGGEMNQRVLIREGRDRGHKITVSGFLGARPQRILRRTGVHGSLRVDWDADLFVLSNLRNCPHIGVRLPHDVIDRALDSGRAAIYEDAWVDVCPFDMPCGGDRSACRPTCERSFANSLYSRARFAVFCSPMQRDMIASVMDVALPERQIFTPAMIDVDRFKPLGLDRDLDVLYVGAISRAKGYYNLLERFGADRLTLAGRSVLDEPVQGNYLGPIPHEDLPELYNRAKIFAHLPEWYEPMGRSVVEASLCGCELVLNDRVGATSYPREHWTDPETVRTHATMFWDKLERLA
jgi:glycosyltransferase involved in cell wall biosynthesis